MLKLIILLLQFFLLLLFLPGALFNNVHQLGEDKLEGRRIRRQVSYCHESNSFVISFPLLFNSFTPIYLVRRELSTANCGKWPSQLFANHIERRIHWHSRFGHNSRVDLQYGIRSTGRSIIQHLLKFYLESTIR
jgi:hypothetical protein